MVSLPPTLWELPTANISFHLGFAFLQLSLRSRRAAVFLDDVRKLTSPDHQPLLLLLLRFLVVSLLPLWFSLSDLS